MTAAKTPFAAYIALDFLNSNEVNSVKTTFAGVSFTQTYLLFAVSPYLTISSSELTNQVVNSHCEFA